MDARVIPRRMLMSAPASLRRRPTFEVQCIRGRSLPKLCARGGLHNLPEKNVPPPGTRAPVSMLLLSYPCAPPPHLTSHRHVDPLYRLNIWFRIVYRSPFPLFFFFERVCASPLRTFSSSGVSFPRFLPMARCLGAFSKFCL